MSTTTEPVPLQVADHTAALTRHLVNTTEGDTLERARRRIELTFQMFYDDEESEPDQAIRDLLTDLMHEASARRVNMEAAIEQAARMFTQEVEEWGDRDED